jgi:hypothetical protein
VQAQVVSQPINISNSDSTIDVTPAIAVDSDSILHVVWEGYYYDPAAPDETTSDIFYSNNKGGTFSKPRMFQVKPDSLEPGIDPFEPWTILTRWYSKYPAIAVDGHNNLHIVFGRSAHQSTFSFGERLYYLQIKSDSTIIGPYPIVHGKYSPIPFSQKIFIDKNDRPIVVYQDFGTTGEDGGIYYLERLYQTIMEVKIAVNDPEIFSSEFYLDKNDKIHIIYDETKWVNDWPYFYTYYTNNISGTFSNAIQINPDKTDTYMFDFTVDKKGIVHIFLTYSSISGEHTYYINNSNGQFSNIQELPTGARIFVDDFSQVHYINPGYYGNNISGNFIFKEISKIGSSYKDPNIIMKNNNEFIFSFWNWLGAAYESDAEIYYFTITNNPTNIRREKNNNIPRTYSLYQNYPNPFNPSTAISFSLPSKVFVSLKIYDLMGKEVATLINKELSIGNYTQQWNAVNLSNGVYFYRLHAGSYTETKKLVLLK